MCIDKTHNVNMLKTYIIDNQYGSGDFDMNSSPAIIGLELFNDAVRPTLTFIFSWETEASREEYQRYQVACVMKSDVLMWEDIVQLLNTIQSVKTI